MNLLARIIGNTPGLRDLHWIIRHYHREMHPRGHFYSPLPDIKKTKANASKIFHPDVEMEPSIDLREDAQRALLEEFSGFYNEFPWLRGRA